LRFQQLKKATQRPHVVVASWRKNVFFVFDGTMHCLEVFHLLGDPAQSLINLRFDKSDRNPSFEEIPFRESLQKFEDIGRYIGRIS